MALEPASLRLRSSVNDKAATQIIHILISGSTAVQLKDILDTIEANPTLILLIVGLCVTLVFSP